MLLASPCCTLFSLGFSSLCHHSIPILQKPRKHHEIQAVGKITKWDQAGVCCLISVMPGSYSNEYFFFFHGMYLLVDGYTCFNIISKRNIPFSPGRICKEESYHQDISSRCLQVGMIKLTNERRTKIHAFLMSIAGGAILWNTDDNFSICSPFDWENTRNSAKVLFHHNLSLKASICTALSSSLVPLELCWETRIVIPILQTLKVRDKEGRTLL